MIHSHFTFVAIVSVLAASSCKSKLEKCMGACDNIKAEDEAACAGNATCLANAADKYASCSRLCGMAFSDGKPSSSVDVSRPSSKTSDLPPADRDEKACEAGNAKACIDTGARYLLGREGRTKDETKAAAKLKKACDLGSVDGCETYARMLDEGRGVPKDTATANTLFTKACDMKAGGACRSLGLNLPTKDPKRIALFEKACELDDGLGCVGLGAAYLHGDQGVKKDPVKAKTFLQKACKLGQQKACEKAGASP
jgi:hypothetical protein